MRFLSSDLRGFCRKSLAIAGIFTLSSSSSVFAQVNKKTAPAANLKTSAAVTVESGKVNDLIKQSWQQNLSGDSNRAIQTAQNALSLADKSTNLQEQIDSLDSLADIFDWNQKVVEQEALRKRALDLALKKYGKTSSIYAKQLAKSANYYVRKGEQGQARSYLDEASNILTNNESKFPLECATYYMVLARRQNSEGSFGLADDSYQKALNLFDGSKQKDPNGMLQVAKEYAALLDTLGKKSEAEKLRDRINLARAGASSGDTSASTTATTGNTNPSAFLKLVADAKQAAAAGDHGKSKALWRLALDDAQKAGNDRKTAFVLVHLGDEARFEKKEEEAISLYRQALSLREKSGSVDNLGMARNLSRLAQCYIMAKKTSEAESLLRKAIEIEDKKDASLSMRAMTLQNLLSAAMMNKNNQQTEDAAKRLLAVSERQDGALAASNKRMAQSMLGAVYMQTGRMNEGISIMKAASADMSKANNELSTKAIMDEYNDADKCADDAELKEAV